MPKLVKIQTQLELLLCSGTSTIFCLTASLILLYWEIDGTFSQWPHTALYYQSRVFKPFSIMFCVFNTQLDFKNYFLYLYPTQCGQTFCYHFGTEFESSDRQARALRAADWEQLSLSISVPLFAFIVQLLHLWLFSSELEEMNYQNICFKSANSWKTLCFVC